MRDVDLILVEGYENEQIPKIGISRKATGKGLPGSPEEYLALVTDEEISSTGVPVFSPDDTNSMIDSLLDIFKLIFQKQQLTIQYFQGECNGKISWVFCKSTG